MKKIMFSLLLAVMTVSAAAQSIVGQWSLEHKDRNGIVMVGSYMFNSNGVVVTKVEMKVDNENFMYYAYLTIPGKYTFQNNQLSCEFDRDKIYIESNKFEPVAEVTPEKKREFQQAMAEYDEQFKGLLNQQITPFLGIVSNGAATLSDSTLTIKTSVLKNVSHADNLAVYKDPQQEIVKKYGKVFGPAINSGTPKVGMTMEMLQLMPRRYWSEESNNGVVTNYKYIPSTKRSVSYIITVSNKTKKVTKVTPRKLTSL